MNLQLAGFQKRTDVPSESLHILLDGEWWAFECHVDAWLLSPLQYTVEEHV